MDSLESALNAASSDEVAIDFSGAADFSPLPDGFYPAVIESVEPGFTGENSKVPGTPKLTFKFVVIEGPQTGRVLFRHAPTAGKGAGLTKDVLRAIGVPGLDSPNIKFKMSSAIGQKVVLEVVAQKDANSPTGKSDKFNEIASLKPYVPAAPATTL